MTPARQAYKQTRDALQIMRDATRLDDLALGWELFLIYHQRTWNKCVAQYKGEAFWTGLQSKYAAIRKSHPTLIYVQQARHVDEHGIEPITEEQPGSTQVHGPGVLMPGTAIEGGGEYTLGPASTATVEVVPGDVLSSPVTNRGVSFDPPEFEGCGTPPVLSIAEEAIKFLDDLFDEIDAAGGN